MNRKPDVFSGSLAGATNFSPANGYTASQLACHNTDATNSFTLAINSSNTWTLAAGEKIGLRLTKIITTVTLTPVAGNPTYQLLLN